MDWFERLTGFRETPEGVRSNLEVDAGRLRSRVNGRSYGVGTLEVVSLASLREQVAALALPPGRLTVSTVVGDVRAMHREPAYRNALFQVASQFNLLEMPSEEVTPEMGVTGYAGDKTQGPACAVAAGAATIYRNYFVEVDGHLGQSAGHQIDCLRDMGRALGNDDNSLWRMRNGYAMCTSAGLRKIRSTLGGMDEAARDKLRSLLQIGLHWNVELTDGVPAGSQFVSQAFCSALPVSYCDAPTRDWQPFATLVLEATYEASLLAALLNARRHGSNMVLLTRVGGGVFGNEGAWIKGAMIRALELFRNHDIDVRLVCFNPPDADQLALVKAFRE